MTTKLVERAAPRRKGSSSGSGGWLGARAVVALLATWPVASRAQSVWVDAAAAQRALEEFKVICEKDAGRLWGVSLCGPVMLVEPSSRLIFTNTRPGEAGAPSTNGWFVATLPASESVSNTHVEWAGLSWAQVQWPVASGLEPQGSVLLHESFHRVAAAEKWPAGSGMPATSNAHLATLEGRYLLQLEWRALERALQAQGASRRSALEDALVFRLARRQRFSKATVEETQGEVGEGLAQYTGFKLAVEEPEGQRALATASLQRGPKAESFIRSFAYASGPAYGLLLDEAGARWRPEARDGADLGALLAKAVGLASPRTTPAELSRRASGYGGPALRASEVERERLEKRRTAELRQKLVVGPVLTVPLEGAKKIQMHPNSLVRLAELGTVYPTARLAGEWGVLTVTEDLLLDDTWKLATVAAPTEGADRRWSGPGWTLELNPGWALDAGPRPEDRRVVRDARGSRD